MQNFCYRCGAIANDKYELIENLCQKCYKELHPLLKIPPTLKLKLCKKCNKYSVKNRWISSQCTDLEAILDFASRESIPYQIQIDPQTEITITTNILGNLDSILLKNQILINICANGNAHKSLEPYTENYATQNVDLIFAVCPSCLSLKRGEYQAVLHIISPTREMTEKESDFILTLIEHESLRTNKVDNLAYITKFTLKKEKMTFYIGSEKFARALALNISYNLGGSSKETYKVGSHRIPKEVKQNKLFISIYLPPFIPGDLLWIKNSPLYIIKVQGKKASCINLLTHQNSRMPLKNLKNAKIVKHQEDLRMFLYFSQLKETIQLMDLKNYQIYEIPFSQKYGKLEIGTSINGFEVNGQIFLILKSN